MAVRAHPKGVWCGGSLPNKGVCGVRDGTSLACQGVRVEGVLATESKCRVEGALDQPCRSLQATLSLACLAGGSRGPTNQPTLRGEGP